MLHGVHSRKSADHILRHWRTYFPLFVILHFKNVQSGQGVNASMDSTSADVIPSSDTIELKKDAEQENCPFWWACSPEKILQQDTYLALAAAFVILRLHNLLFPKIISFAKWAWRRHTLFANLMNMHEYFFTYLEQGRQKFNKVYPSKRGNLHEGARNATAWASKSLASVSIGEPSTSLVGICFDWRTKHQSDELNKRANMKDAICQLDMCTIE